MSEIRVVRFVGGPLHNRHIAVHGLKQTFAFVKSFDDEVLLHLDERFVDVPVFPTETQYGLVAMISDRQTLYYEYHCGDPLDSLDDQLTAIGEAFAAEHPWEQHVGSWAVRLLLGWLARPA